MLQCERHVRFTLARQLCVSSRIGWVTYAVMIRCVCEWAFARYIQKAGGCDKIQKIVCDATNMKALTHYEAQQSRPDIKMALDCLKSRCLEGNQ